MKRSIVIITAFVSALILVFSAAHASDAPEKNEDRKTHTHGGSDEACKGDCTKYSFKFSGYFKADLAYDNDRISPGNYAILVNPGNNDAMNITARETRLGLDFKWKEEDFVTDARLEFDFYGLGAKPSSFNSMENKAAPMLRHAYLKVTRGHWSILAGQTSDVISPLVPKTVNYTVAWGQGNIGYRRPQFRISAWMGFGDGAKVTCTVAATRNLGSNLDDNISNTIDDGADSAIPAVQGRLGLKMKFGEGGTAAVGVSGHFGVEEYYDKTLTDENVPVGEAENESWSLNADAAITLNEYVALSGEFFTGQKLGTYFGGVLQNVNPSTLEEIGAMGGWGMVHLKPYKRIGLNIGYAFDNPDKEDFEVAEGAMIDFIDKNDVVMGNIMYNLTGTVTAMLEVSYLRTVYALMEGAEIIAEEELDALRVQFAMKAAIK
ncbi:MAG: hypothetical protein JSV33_07280 [bacterium]|nr:MAG: hypothetical protein JSV33_07280 [bacterium]